MDEKQYNKLVRDNIPDIIRNDGNIPVTRVLGNDEYIACLHEKLQEEVAEYLKDNSLEELCDVWEVLEAISSVMEFSKDEIERTKLEKAEKNGVFKDRIFLEKVIVSN
ncbi:nucleoside triphosphate pyrophosphohydrolase [Desulfitobacterium metallireducens]|uniref:Phosphoribosyl-ATP pyrophosphohydrolase n=1 Tax=Desulfitobacterium metallireducens DSM 15288 TaxID=871968 RepID=W0E9W9_9FIRM|nr:nucleoside triphosphate pyrophosphohydrolase [Desulfitobacterium metallireducens]AHF06024.1 phosphoribosyl-ATP pyrophosphohydrolase [Desulfitobacterium metallireducens DSM 15288]